MEPGELRRWKTPWDIPPFNGSEFFLIARVSDYSIDFLTNGELVRGWRYDYIIENSEPIHENR